MKLTPVNYDPFSPGMQLSTNAAKPYTNDLNIVDPSFEQVTQIAAGIEGEPVTQQQKLSPVTNDPFASQIKLTPVDFDPFAVKEEEKPSTFSSRVKNIVDRRQTQMQNSADAFVAGDQSLPETMAQQGLAFGAVVPDTIGEALSSITPQPVKDALSATVSAVGKLPSFSGRTIGEDVPKELNLIAENNPRLARNAQAGMDALSLAGTGYGIKSAVNVADQLGSKALKNPIVKNYLADERTAAGVAADTPKIDDLGAFANDAYDEAAYIGAKFTPEQVSNRIADELERAIPTPIAGKVLTDEDNIFIKNLKEYEGFRGQDLSLDDIKRLDETLSAKITAKFINPKTGMPDANGRRLQQFQYKMREIVDNVNNPGNDALVNGRTFWAAKRRVDDLEAIAERASVATNPEKALQAGYRALYNDKDAIRGWPEEAVQLLKKAATPGFVSEALGPITNRLLAVVSLGSGNLAAGATAQLGGMAARGLKGAVIARRGRDVQQAITENAFNKVRPVKYPSPSEIANLTREEKAAFQIPLQLAAPNKITPMMTDEQVNIAQKLMEGGKRPTPDSGAAVKPPVSQLTNVRQKLGAGKGSQFDALVEIYKQGDISQNRFVDDVMGQFGLTTKQARELAKEIKTYGDSR